MTIRVAFNRMNTTVEVQVQCSPEQQQHTEVEKRSECVCDSRRLTSGADDGICPSHHFFIIFSPLHNSDINAFTPETDNKDIINEMVILSKKIIIVYYETLSNSVFQRNRDTSAYRINKYLGSCFDVAITEGSSQYAPRCWCGCCVSPADHCSWTPSWQALKKDTVTVNVFQLLREFFFF